MLTLLFYYSLTPINKYFKLEVAHTEYKKIVYFLRLDLLVLIEISFVLKLLLLGCVFLNVAFLQQYALKG